MNINSINSKDAGQTSTSSKQNSNLTSIGKKGEVIEGLVSKVSDKISINFNGKEVSVSKSAVRDAKEGEIRKFEIKDISDTSIVLKEVGSDTKDTGTIQAVCTNVETNQTTFKEHLEKSVGEKNAEEERAQKAEEAKEKLDDIASRMTAKDYEALMKEGSVLEAYDVVRLDMALERVKEQRTATEETIEKQVTDGKEQIREMEETAQKSDIKGKSAAEEAIIERLIESNLPITDENIEKIGKALELAGSLDKISDKDMNYLISNQKNPTISNLYKASYSSTNMHYQPISESAWNEIKGQAETILAGAGLEVNEENLANARWLIDHNLELTKENLKNLTNLKEINDILKSVDFKQELLGKIIDSAAKGIPPEQTQMIDNTEKAVKELLDVINKTTDAAIVKAAESSDNISASDLKKAEKVLAADSSATQQSQISFDDDIHVITARRQLEEIRLKMTTEAAGTMSSKGIDIHTESLEKIVQELREQENSYYRNLLKESGTAESTENIKILKDTTEKVNQLKELPSYLLGSTVNSRKIETIDSLCIEGNNIKARLDKAGATYDTLMTAPRKDLGDSIQKAFHNVDSLLKDMDLEITDANRRAVKILGYNNMTINEESITRIKEYDAKLNGLIRDLHPAATVELVKEGINPLDMPVDELTEKVNELKKELGVTGEEKYSRYLWKLERESSISPEDRKAYIGIYRLLNNIEKTDGAAIGAVVKAEQDMTLKNLLTAARTIRSGGVNTEVNDKFGALESISFQNETITDQIQSAFQGEKQTDAKTEYYNTLVNNIMDEITPAKLNEVSKAEGSTSTDNLLNMSVEKLSEALHQAEEGSSLEKEYLQEKVETIQNLAKDSKDAIEFLQDYNIPTSVANLEAAKEFMTGDGNIYRKVKDALGKSDEKDRASVLDTMEKMPDSLEDGQAVEAQFNKFKESVSHILNKQLGEPNITSKDIADLKNLRNGIQLVASLGGSRTYEIPLLVGDSVTNINLTIVSGGKENGKIDVTVSSQNLGTIEAGFSVKDGEVKGLIMCNNREALDAMKEVRGNLETGITGNGLNVKQLNYGIDHKISASYTNKLPSGEETTETDTHLLYKTAKAFVYNVKEAEMRKEW